MADGILCQHCGYSESLHGRPLDVDDPEIAEPDYSESLTTCKGYTPDDPERASRLAEAAEKENYEREMAKFGHRPR